MGIALRLLTILALAFVRPLLFAWSASTMWSWFVARDLGPGPSYAAWFGLSMILGVILALNRSIKKDDEHGDERDRRAKLTSKMDHWLALSFGRTAVAPVVVFVSWAFGTAVGWM